MTNDAIATIAIVLLVVGNVWQWWQREDMKRRLQSQQVVIDIYRDKSGPVWGGMDKVLDDAMPEEL